MAAHKFLFCPDSLEKKSNSAASLKAQNRFLATYNPPGLIKNSVFCNIRKNLPQTSNRLLKFKNRAKVSEMIKNTQKTDKVTKINTSDEDFQRKISPVLSKLLYKISQIYKNCQIIPDNSYPEHGQYSYLFDKHCKRIDKFSDIKEKPEYLLITCRFNLPDLVFQRENKRNSESPKHRSVNYINLFSSSVLEDSTRSPVKAKKFSKNSLVRIKSVNTKNRPIKSPDSSPTKDTPFQSVKHFFPCSTGKKLKEGTGGFRKAHLLFEKRKYSLTPTPVHDHSMDLGPRLSFSPPKLSSKDLFDYDDLCMKYSLTKQEFLNIFAHYSYLKENCQSSWTETLAETYKISENVVRAVNSEQKPELELEDFLKFYIIVVLKRAKFQELVSFIQNLWKIDENCEQVLVNSSVISSNSNFHEKAVGIIQLLKQGGVFDDGLEVESNDFLINLQDLGVSIYDLRLIVMLIVKSL